MSNPFTRSEFTHGEFKAHIKKQLSPLEIDQCTVLDYGTEPKNKMRMTVSKVGSELGFKVATKTSSNGDVWVKRIK